MYTMQNGRCLICQNFYEVLIIDHCHKTNKVRGLLCSTCNMGLGMFKDNREFLMNAVTYINTRG